VKGQLTKAELIERIERLKSGRWTENEAEILFREISVSVPCPYSHIQGYIFHAPDNPSAETIVDRLLAYNQSSFDRA
jgi:hypothetical protein